MDIVKSSLPALNSEQVQKSGLSDFCNRYSIYRCVLKAEAHAIREGKQEHVVAARVVGYVLLEFHAQRYIYGDTPCSALCRWVTSSVSEDRLDVVFKVGLILRDQFIVRVFNDKDTPPSFSACPSRPSFDRLQDMIADSLQVSRDDYETSRKKVLARDGYRCMVTKLVDMNSYARCVELEAAVLRDSLPSGPVETAYILNESTLRCADLSSACATGNRVAFGVTECSPATQIHDVVGPLEILRLFGFSDIVDAIEKPGGVHQPWNLLSVDPIVHFYFDHQSLWFERTNREHCYKVRLDSERNEAWIRAARRNEADPMVVDMTPKLQNVPPPMPALLDLHATCARVAHMSGATEFFKRLQRDAEDTDVLAFDGSSADLLDDLLSPFAVPVVV